MWREANMTRKLFRATVSKGLAVPTVTLIAALILAPGAWAVNTYNILHYFTRGAGGRGAISSLIFDAAGNLYGTTIAGGSGRNGTVFELTPNQNGSWTESVLYSFSGGDDGGNPYAGVIFDQSGNLYGTTYAGGADGDGTVFELTPDQGGGWTESVLYSFTGSDGDAPVAGVIFDAVGNLYGTTTSGGAAGDGTVFELTPNQGGGWTESVLYSFKGGNDGSYPDRGSLVFDATGDLYGAAASGGKGGCNVFAAGCGAIYELIPGSNGTWTEQVLHRFLGGREGDTPEGALIFDNSGNLYDTTWLGGSHGVGNVFELTPTTGGGWKEKVLYQFQGGSYGPTRGVIFDQAGDLCGTKEDGGAHGAGYVFELTPQANGSWKQKVLHQFTGKDGANSWAAPIFDAKGNLYGTTESGGHDDGGVVYEIIP
jgi:uncharacterized repeat protein (TIGR03803 family)